MAGIRTRRYASDPNAIAQKRAGVHLVFLVFVTSLVSSTSDDSLQNLKMEYQDLKGKKAVVTGAGAGKHLNSSQLIHQTICDMFFACRNWKISLHQTSPIGC